MRAIAIGEAALILGVSVGRFGSELIFNLGDHFGVEEILLESPEKKGLEANLCADVIELMMVFSASGQGLPSLQLPNCDVGIQFGLMEFRAAKRPGFRLGVFANRWIGRFKRSLQSQNWFLANLSG